MSELAPGSPWKATVLLAAALPCLAPRRAFAIARLPALIGRLWAAVSPVGQVRVNHPVKSEKPRKIRDLRRSAARGRCGDAILLRRTRPCYSSGRKFWALRDPTMASFNTVAGCILASALFAMVVGKISDAVVHAHKLEK